MTGVTWDHSGGYLRIFDVTFARTSSVNAIIRLNPSGVSSGIVIQDSLFKSINAPFVLLVNDFEGFSGQLGQTSLSVSR